MDPTINRSSTGSGDDNGTANGGAAEYKELDVDGAVVDVQQSEGLDQDSTVVFVSIAYSQINSPLLIKNP